MDFPHQMREPRLAPDRIQPDGGQAFECYCGRVHYPGSRNFIKHRERGYYAGRLARGDKGRVVAAIRFGWPVGLVEFRERT